ncbi:MAG: VTT domain-containing protein [Aestuariivirga sp.]
MEYIQPYLDYFSQNPEWAIAVIFLIAFGEALLIIGLFVPSTAVLVGAGMLVGTGHLEFWPVFLATTVGAILGDQISYWAGRLFGERLKTMWPLNRYPNLVARGEDFVRQHGGKSIAIGRFVPGVKAVVPGIVGMLGMSQLYFVVVNFTSGIVWGAAHIFPGMLLGQSIMLAGELSGRLVVVLLILLAILAIAGWLIRLAAAGISPHLDQVLHRLSQWASSKNSRSMRRLGRALSPQNPRSLLIVLFAAILVAALVALVDLFAREAGRDTISNMDISVFRVLQEIRNAPADELMITTTMLGDGLVLTAMFSVMVGWLLWRKAWRAAFAAIIVFVSGKLFVLLIKFGLQRQRPFELEGINELFSFPSSHATMSAIAFGVLAVLASHAMSRWGRAVVYAICGMIVTAIAFSRLYLGAHWLSDVIGGLFFATVLVAAFGIVIEAIPPRRIRPLGLLGATFIAFMAAGAAHIDFNYGKAEQLYAARSATRDIALEQWQSGDWKKLPPRRIDLAGRPEEHFAAQWLGGLDELKQVLSTAGWVESPGWKWRDSINYLNPGAPLDELRPRPALHEGLKAKLTMVRPVPDRPDQRLVLRTYWTGLQVSDGSDAMPLYLLSVTREGLRRRFHLYSVPAAIPAPEDDEAQFRGVLAAAKQVRIVANGAAEPTSPALLMAIP